MNRRLVYIYSEKCDVCKAYENTVYDMCVKHNVDFETLDIDENIEYCRDTIRIPGVPMLIMYDDENKELDRWYGVYDEKNLNNWMVRSLPVVLPTFMAPDVPAAPRRSQA